MGDHIFPIEKYTLLHERSLAENVLKEDDFTEPSPVSDDDLKLVHLEHYLLRLEMLADSPFGMMNGENPVNWSILEGSRLACGGTYLACRIALECGMGMNLGGGFHHAFPDHEEGFCYYSDIAIAIRKLKGEGMVGKVMVIDCDVHQGNGTAFIFRDDSDVFTFSIHQEDNYPPKEKSDHDIGLYSWDGVDDEVYLRELRVLDQLVPEFAPGLAIYIAGADVYMEDQLGGFRLTKGGIAERDDYVIGTVRGHGVPLAALLGGGYAIDKNDTVEIHLNTIRMVKGHMGEDV